LSKDPQADASPDAVRATGDPGDDTARRYRYQFTYAGILCCSLLDDTLDAIEVFCEHHEDVLVKHADGLFTGCQVKTRAPEGIPWKANDEAIVAACARFVTLENAFPDKFRAFAIVTNHMFYSNAKTATCLPYLLELSRACDSISKADKKLKTFLRKISRKAKCSDNVAFTAVRKMRLDHAAPKLDDITTRLVNDLTLAWPRARDCSWEVVQLAARQLIAACHEASSLAHADALPSYLVVSADPVATETQRRIDGKRIDRARLEAILDSAHLGTELLEGPQDAVPLPSEGTGSLLRQKLDAGGFSATSVDSAINLRSKAEFLGIRGTKQHGKDEGLRRYDHLRSIVLLNCADAFEGRQKDDGEFGREMLTDLRTRLTVRRGAGEHFFGWRDEHLEGLAYVLTGECQVRWSTDAPWEKAD